MPLNLDLSVLASFTLLSLAVVPCLCSYTPIGPNLSAVFFWRCRRVQGWQRNVWRFLYRNRLEASHWVVLEQDRVMLESMAQRQLG